MSTKKTMTSRDVTGREKEGAKAKEGRPPKADIIGASVWRYRRLLLLSAAALVAVAYFLPFWQITLHAPQYPKGLTVQITGSGTKGDVSEVDELNHYIGMMPMEELAKPERMLWPWGVALLILVLVAAALLKGRISALLVFGAATYPVIFAVDLYRWLYYSGHHLDQKAALSGAIKPFMPAFFGRKMVAQFETVASFGLGFYLALTASVLAVAAGVVAWREAPQQ
jgi:copper chaperone NosL